MPDQKPTAPAGTPEPASPSAPGGEPAPVGTQDLQAELAELEPFAQATAHEAEVFIGTLAQVASGDSADQAIPLLLLATAEILTTGSRLGAIGDVVPVDRYETDPGPDADPDLDPLRDSLANLFDGIDEYADVVDPLTSAELTRGQLSADLTDIASALSHGLAHHRAGRWVEALWWWQFSYLSSWGDRAASALRVLQAILAHLRLDADDDVVAEAEFDALHP